MTIEQDKFISILDEKAKEAGAISWEDFFYNLGLTSPEIFRVEKIITAAAEQYKEQSVRDFIAEVKKEFADQNFDYLDFIADRKLPTI